MVHERRPDGGSISLIELIDQHGEAIEADLQEVYQVDLTDFFRGTLPARRVLRLVGMLPDTSRFAAQVATLPGTGKAIRPPAWREHYGWGADRHMTANLWDLLAEVNKGGRKAVKHPRPGRAKAQGTPMSVLMAAARKQAG